MLLSPVINFNGAFVVDTLVVGSLLIGEKRVFAVRIELLQTRSYPVIAHGQNAAEVYAYCLEGYRQGKKKLEVYSPCYLVVNEENASPVSVVSRITWYLSARMKKQCAGTVRAILEGDIPGDDHYPTFEGKPFAKLIML